MELGLAALASLGAGGAAASSIGGAAALATGAAATGGSLLGALGASSGALGILAGTTTAVSALQQLQQGGMKADQAEYSATVARNDAVGQQAAGLQQRAAINREALKTLGENDVAYAAGGVDLSYGEAASSRSRTLTRASDELAIGDSSTRAKIAGNEAAALNYDRMSRQYRSGALLAALAETGKGVLQFSRRGSV